MRLRRCNARKKSGSNEVSKQDARGKRELNSCCKGSWISEQISNHS